MHPKPLTNIRMANIVKGVGPTCLKILTTQKAKLDNDRKGNILAGPPALGKYASPAAAVLVALLEYSESK